jgi:hypothetical protein
MPESQNLSNVDDLQEDLQTGLDRITQVRQQLAQRLNTIASTISQAELVAWASTTKSKPCKQLAIVFAKADFVCSF